MRGSPAGGVRAGSISIPGSTSLCTQCSTDTHAKEGGWTPRCGDLLTSAFFSSAMAPCGIQLLKEHLGCLLSCGPEHIELTFLLSPAQGAWERAGRENGKGRGPICRSLVSHPQAHQRPRHDLPALHSVRFPKAWPVFSFLLSYKTFKIYIFIDF